MDVAPVDADNWLIRNGAQFGLCQIYANELWHFELAADQQAEVDRVLGLGARHVDIGQCEESWVVLADPEGNEFCILAPND